jgi:hypothetical protein
MQNYYLKRAENKISPKLVEREVDGYMGYYVELSDGTLVHLFDWLKQHKRKDLEDE